VEDLKNLWLKQKSADAGEDPSLYPMHVLLGRNAPKKGEIGLEIEVEGNQFPKSEEYSEEEGDMSCDYIPSMWQYVHDGSLRGFDNAEYVLRGPAPFDSVPDALDSLWRMFEDYGSVLDESHRTSVHVHLNAQSWHLNRVASFCALYVSVEDILTHWCGDRRVGNLFCLRVKDAPAIISKIRRMLASGKLNHLDDGLHYSGLNLHALRKHGSIEVRTMRGVNDPEIIQTWVNILRRIYELSDSYPDPRVICERFSGSGAMEFLMEILGSNYERVVRECGMSVKEIRYSLHEGIRFAQSICYCRRWEDFISNKATPDPFGRTASKAVKLGGWASGTTIAYSDMVAPAPSDAFDLFIAQYTSEPDI